MMIYVDIQYFNEKKIYDAYVDEKMSAESIINELKLYFGDGGINLFSLVNQKMLCEGKSLKQQGVKGGDTLILIMEEK